MFATLSDRLTEILTKLRSNGRLTDADIDATAHEIRLALLEADVALPVVRAFIAAVKERARGAEVSQALNPAQQVIKIVHEELIGILGGQARRLEFAKQPPTVIMLAGLQGVPTELYDAAKVDGANAWQTFWKVTFPMISPVIFYNLVLSVVGLFQYFLVPLVVNSGTGRPGGATMFYNLYLYKTFFTYQNMSYGSTLAWFLFLVILLVTIVLFGTAKYWVYYAGEARS